MEKQRARILTPGMKKTLVDVAFGVRKYRDGYRSEDTGERVDHHSIEALFRLDLVDWRSHGGVPNVIRLYLTEAGERIFEEELS